MRRVAKMLAVCLAVLGAVQLAAFTGFQTGTASAQQAEASPDYQSWSKVAGRAENALSDRRASVSALEQLRADLVGWRTVFLAAQDINRSRIATLQNQISALGPEPADGSSEPEALAARRAELGALLIELSSPGLRAQEARSRASGLIGELDALVRQRQTARLFELGPTPLNPTIWPDALGDAGASWTLAAGEVKMGWQSVTQQKLFRGSLPVTVIYLLVAFVLLLRGRYWMVNLTQKVQAAPVGSLARVYGLGVSLGQVVLPVLGIYAFVQAVNSTGFAGLRGQIIIDALPSLGLAFFGARWLSLRLFPKISYAHSFLQVTPETGAVARRYGAAAGLIWGVERPLAQLAEFDGYSAASQAVLHFVLILAAGFILYKLGRVLRACACFVPPAGDAAAPGEPDADDAAHARSLRARALDLIGRVLILVAAAASLVAAVGYVSAAQAVVYPTIQSLGLLALLLVASALAREIYAAIAARDDGGRDALIPWTVTLFLVLGAVPLFALIWGARGSDLAEIWGRFTEGVQLGDARVSPTDFLTFAIVFVVGYLATRLLQSTLRASILPKTRIDAGGRNAIVSGTGYFGIFLAAVIAISTAGIDLSSLAIVAGALSVGIGFGLQNIVSNFVSGIILLIERPIAEGDWIEVGANMGTVRSISVRSTRIETFDRTDVIVPNSDLVSGTVTNYTRGNLVGRAKVAVGVAYGSDTRHVQKVLEEIAANHPMVALNPPPSVHFVGFGPDSLDFQVRVILRDVNFGLSVKTELHHLIVERFAREGIEIPFAQRDVWLRNPEVLPGASNPKPKPKPKARDTKA